MIKGSKNVTFEATYDTFASTGEGNVGSLDGLQPLDVSVEGSTIVKFDHMRVTSSNGEPFGRYLGALFEAAWAGSYNRLAAIAVSRLRCNIACCRAYLWGGREQRIPAHADEERKFSCTRRTAN